MISIPNIEEFIWEELKIIVGIEESLKFLVLLLPMLIPAPPIINSDLHPLLVFITY